MKNLAEDEKARMDKFWADRGEGEGGPKRTRASSTDKTDKPPLAKTRRVEPVDQISFVLELYDEKQDAVEQDEKVVSHPCAFFCRTRALTRVRSR